MSGHADTIRERTRYWQDSGGRYVVAASDFDALVAENQQLRDAGQRLHDLRRSAESCLDPAEAPLKGEWDEAWFSLRAALAGTPSEDT